MPQDKSYRSPRRWKAQSPTTPASVTNTRIHRTPEMRDGKPVTFCELGFMPSPPFMTEHEAGIIRDYRRGLNLCVSDKCTCYCRCHTGNMCPVEETGVTYRTHTQGHKPTRHVVRRDQECPKCPDAGTNHDHIITCHDTSDTPSRFHLRGN